MTTQSFAALANKHIFNVNFWSFGTLIYNAAPPPLRYTHTRTQFCAASHNKVYYFCALHAYTLFGDAVAAASATASNRIVVILNINYIVQTKASALSCVALRRRRTANASKMLYSLWMLHSAQHTNTQHIALTIFIYFEGYLL